MATALSVVHWLKGERQWLLVFLVPSLPVTVNS